jgi:4'-phosphopantetheinyl transferase
MQAAAALWLARADRVSAATLADYRGWLGAGEAARYAGFKRPARQRQFLVGRGLLRQALGHLLALAPATIRLEERPGMAPSLSTLRGVPGMSISHSGPWVACAVSGHTALGLDIEQRDASRDLLALAGQAFDADIVAALAALSPAARVTDFYRRWSTQEARIKLGSPDGAVPPAIATTTTTTTTTTCDYVEVPHPDCAIVICSAHPISLSVHTPEGR